MLQHLELLCTQKEVDAVCAFVETQTHCTVEDSYVHGRAGARTVVRLEPYGLNMMSESEEDSEEGRDVRASWARFVQAFHARFGY